MEQGEFLLITGPMFASKSKYLIEHYEGQENVEAFMPSINTREETITSRAYHSRHIPCTKITEPMDLTKSSARTIILEEYQFLGPVERIIDAVKTLKEQHKKVVFAGLDLLANGNEWQNYTALKDICDKELKLKARCQVCGKPASFTALISGDKTKSVQIEGEAIYEPRCREHFSII